VDCRNKDGDETEKDNKDDSCIEDKTLNTTSRLEDGACTHAPKGTSKPCAPCLKQNKNNDGNTENDLNNSQCRKILCKQRISSFSELNYAEKHNVIIS